MNCDPDPRELQIIRSWQLNAIAWSDAIRTASIASRKLVTDRAIIEAVSSVSPHRVLDIGCGEGWLARALASSKIHFIGIDAVPALVAQAQALGGWRVSRAGICIHCEAATAPRPRGRRGV